MSKQEDIAISVKNVSKAFKLPHEKQSSIKGMFVNMFRGKRTYERQQVLKDVSFDIKKGEFFGIVGRNGSGKSTLLKLLSGIYAPDKGSIEVSGKLVPFIELGVGFNHELTGRENVFLNGALLGFTRKEMEAMYDEVVEFAELEKFMDQKLKNYSSGMQVRLAFSIAIRANTDILVLDEVLAVGDEAFQRKCFQYFAELKRDKKTVILVTHSMDHVQQFCTKAMLLNNGEIVELGRPSKVAGKYLELNSGTINREDAGDGTLTNDQGVTAKLSMQNEGNILVFSTEVRSEIPLDDIAITFMINRDTGEVVYRWASDDSDKQKISIKDSDTVKIHIELDNIFPDGEFDVQLAIKKRDRSKIYALFNRVLAFRLVNPDVNKRNNHWKPNEKSSIELKRAR